MFYEENTSTPPVAVPEVRNGGPRIRNFHKIHEDIQLKKRITAERSLSDITVEENNENADYLILRHLVVNTTNENGLTSIPESNDANPNMGQTTLHRLPWYVELS